MNAEDVFRRVVDALERAGIPYMLTGSFASAFHGVPRATQDIDMVIAPTADQVRALVRLLPVSEYYVDEAAALDAHRRQAQFNIVDFASGWKIDLIIRKSRPFSHAEFDRRSVVDFRGLRLAIATAEDVVIAKLEWAKLGESQRQIEDVAGILRIRASELDRAYLHHWLGQLHLQTQWKAACRTAGVAA
jgi:hypothetical protein